MQLEVALLDAETCLIVVVVDLVDVLQAPAREAQDGGDEGSDRRNHRSKRRDRPVHLNPPYDQCILTVASVATTCHYTIKM